MLLRSHVLLLVLLLGLRPPRFAVLLLDDGTVFLAHTDASDFSLLRLAGRNVFVLGGEVQLLSVWPRRLRLQLTWSGGVTGKRLGRTQLNW